MSYDTNSSLDRALELAKKRAAQFAGFGGGDTESSPAKRHLGGGGQELYLKFLIPGFVTGHIIGRGGETIAELRKTSGAYIKTSKNNEFFPGTQDRVGLISGPREAIADMVKLLDTKIKERLAEVGEGDTERYRSIKIAVPESTMGMIIGKGGETIAEMRQRSGATILTQKKAPEEKLAERMVTLIGEPRSNELALDMILEKISDDPNSGSCQEINYSESSGGSSYGYGSRPDYRSSASTGGGGGGAAAAAPGYDTINVNGHTNLRLTLNMQTPIAPDPWVSSQAMPHINYSLRQAGHSDTVADELTRALGLLAAHGVLQLSQSAASVQPATTGWAGEHADAYSAYGYGATQPAQPAPPGGHKSMPVREKTPPGEPSGHMDEEVQVEDRIVGAVLGPGGQHLTQMRQYSGADVQISKRGIYAPGTTNRVISIKGSSRAVKCAVLLVQQKIQEKKDTDATYDRKRGGC